MIGLEQTAEPFNTLNFGVVINVMCGLDDSAQRLMNSLVMVIVAILIDDILKLLN